jgi:SAM-dependent methyltransferase
VIPVSNSERLVANRQEEIDAYNRFQREYCEHAISRTIVPRDSRHLRRQLDETIRVAEVSGVDRVLEVGCGMGRFTLMLAERGVRVEGLDLSPGLLDRLRAFGGARYDIPLHCADALEPPATLNGSFDVVLGFFVLHHLKDLHRAVAAMSRMLKPGGRLVLLDANGWNPLFYLQLLTMPGMTWRGDRGMAQMRPAVVFAAMKSAGLSRLTLSRFGFMPGFVVDRAWGSRLDLAMERLPLPDVFHAFQIFRAQRAVA